VLCNLKKAYSRICSPGIRHHVHGSSDPDIPRQHCGHEISEFDCPLIQCHISEENPQRHCRENRKTFSSFKNSNFASYRQKSVCQLK